MNAARFHGRRLFMRGAFRLAIFSGSLIPGSGALRGRAKAPNQYLWCQPSRHRDLF
jgi:hypothetical protein